jgi:CSLREA domain-containing protein
VLAVLLTLAVPALPVGATGGATATGVISVTTVVDAISTDGRCSLREAIIAANKDRASSSQAGECRAGSGNDTIVLPAGVYILTRSDNGSEDSSSTGDLDVRSVITIAPTGAVEIQGAPGFTDRLFHILSGKLVLSDAWLKGGKAKLDGGAILNQAALDLRNVTLSGNSAAAAGGALASSGSTTAVNITVAGNAARLSGGGIHVSGGVLTLTHATITGNAADSDANRTGDGGGLSRTAGTLTLVNSVLWGNSDGSASPIHAPECSGVLVKGGPNLVGSLAGCGLSPSGTITGRDPMLGPLQHNGGTTPTRQQADGSPVIDVASAGACPASDQRGASRPYGAGCDLGAVEAGNAPQAGPVFFVVTAGDSGEQGCYTTSCTFRAAILAANARPNNAQPDEIRFNLPLSGGVAVLSPLTALPPITSPVLIDGSSQPGGPVALTGAQAGPNACGLTLDGSGIVVRNLTISGFSGDGVCVLSGAGNTISRVAFSENGDLGIDLGNDGPTPNDTLDGDGGPNLGQNAPVLLSAAPLLDGGLRVTGRLNSSASTRHAIELFGSPVCDPSGYGEGAALLQAVEAQTDSTGDAYFTADLSPVPGGFSFLTATATSTSGSTSEFSACQATGQDNTSWPKALELAPDGGQAIDGVLQRLGESRWYRFDVQPGTKLVLTLTGLPANYDLAVYKDIAKAYRAMAGPQDINLLGAEFAPDSFSPDSFSPDSFSPDSFSPDSFSPDSFSPDTFSPDVFSPDSFSADVFTPDSFSPDSFSPDSFSPDSFSPDSFSPDSFSPDSFSPDTFSPDSFSSAQTRSLLGVSAYEGVAGEGIALNTWNNNDDIYVRVRGRNGAFDPGRAFTLGVQLLPGVCEPVQPITVPTSLSASGPGIKTVILTHSARVAGTPEEKAALSARLAALAARPEVTGVVVEVTADARVQAALAQADQYPTCPYATNEAAGAIKAVIDRYRAANPGLEYVVLVGNDDAIPFFRHPDQAMLANESNYVPPVREGTTSQASLRYGYVLSQDDYGAAVSFSHKDDIIPVPLLAVGRLVESAANIDRVLSAYLATPAGVQPTPTSALVTGYDFLEDAATAVRDELVAGLGGATLDTLIAPRDLSPQDPAAWTAAQLADAFLSQRRDISYLAGHFSASSALAADYATRLTTEDLLASGLDLSNALVFSAGCHSGYGIVDPHGVPGVTREPDWAQAFAHLGATLVAGTGYQYGDTDFLEYSERLYLMFTRQLRTGAGPVAIGKALASAKAQYLAETPQLRGLHEKAYLEATLFGLPMLKVNMPGSRIAPPSQSPATPAPAPVATDPGATLQLSTADVSLTPQLVERTVPLVDVTTGAIVTTRYYEGPDGVFAPPGEPVLPLVRLHASHPGAFLRGAGFRGGAYEEAGGVIPLIGSATTELRGVHAPFTTDEFYPIRWWGLNHLGALTGGPTRLEVLPVQFEDDSPSTPEGVFRKYNRADFRLFYSESTGPSTDGTYPALSDAPDITQVVATPESGSIKFGVRVTGNPSAGIQQVWVTWTDLVSAFPRSWQSLDLVQDLSDSTLWRGELAIGGTSATDIRFIVQAVSGVGMVALDANQGAGFIPGALPQPDRPTSLVLLDPAGSGEYGGRTGFTALLTSGGTPLAGRTLVFRLGGQSRVGVTDATGRATVSFSLLGIPGPVVASAAFAGDSAFLPSNTSSAFQLSPQGTRLTLVPSPASASPDQDGAMTATLTGAAARPLGQRTVVFSVSGPGGSLVQAAITDYAGRAQLGPVSLPDGSFVVEASFGTDVTAPGGDFTTADPRYVPSTASGTLTLVSNHPPLCQGIASTSTLWPPDKSMWPVSVNGVSDPDGDPVTITITQIRQDERVGSGSDAPDGSGLGTPTAFVRSQRDGNGDGRVYHIYYDASDGRGGTCHSEVVVGTVPHDQSGTISQVDGGPLYDSTLPD